MCGICGFYGFEDQSLLKKMTSALYHRGPDDQGFYQNKTISLGHRRLSIIDLVTGRQPIHNEDKTIYIVYNGEIYNFPELKADLEKRGHEFYTKTDTEVIVHSYEEYGEKCIRRFNGMFAFALWDSNEKKLILARDRLGIKPLYYFENDGKIAFASEIKALLHWKVVKRELNKDALAEYITFQNLLGYETFFKGIKMLPQGSYLEFESGGMHISQYWTIELKEKKRTDNEVIKEFREILDKSVKRHMISDVPVGSYMSGGFDSTSVSTVASRYYQEKFKTFTGSFNDIDYDEVPLANLVNKKIGAEGYAVEITPENFKQDIEKIVWHVEQPLLALQLFSQYEVAKLASAHVKVVLTGHGGDEMFAGYPVYKATLIKEYVKNPFKWWKIPMMLKPSELLRAAYFLFYPLIQNEVKHGIFIMFPQTEHKKLFTQQFYEKIKHFNIDRTVEQAIGKTKNSTDKTSKLYFKTYLNSLLILEDKMSMAHSVEGRTPLLDNELLEFALSVPLEQKLGKRELKHIMKEGMKRQLPGELYKAPKRGFPTPLAKWFRNELKDYIYETLLAENRATKNIFREDYIRKLLELHCSRKTDNLLDLVNANRIWSLLCIEIWLRAYKINN